MFFKRLSGHPTFDHTAPQVWVNQTAKWRGLAGAATLALAADKWVVVVAHFPQTLTEAYTALTEAHLPCTVYETLRDQPQLVADLAQFPSGKLWLCLAEVLAPGPKTLANLPEKAHALVLGAELHFLPAPDAAVETWAKALPGSATFTTHVAMDDVLLQYFGATMLQGLVQQLQLAPDEPLNSPLVARSLEAAQQRMARMAHSHAVARSAAEWAQQNLPPKM